MFKLNPIPKEIIRNKRTSVVKNYEGNDVTLILGTSYTVDESLLNIYNPFLDKIADLIQTENQKNNIEDWIDYFYRNLKEITYWLVYTTSKGEILFYVVTFGGSLEPDNSIFMKSNYFIFTFGLNEKFEEFKHSRFRYEHSDILEWWLKKNGLDFGSLKEKSNDEESAGFGADLEFVINLDEFQKIFEYDDSKELYIKRDGSECKDYIKEEFLIYDNY